MGAVTALPWGRPLTRADLRELPDDGHRYELLDGTLLVSPSPSLPHQRAVGRLHLLLAGACPPDLEVVLAPFDVTLADDTVLQPDLLVVRRATAEAGAVPLVPHLVVEVLSPSSRRIDLLLKRARYEAAGIPAYWVVDPEEPSTTVHELHRGRYGETARAAGTKELHAEQPCRVTVVPLALVG